VLHSFTSVVTPLRLIVLLCYIQVPQNGKPVENGEDTYEVPPNNKPVEEEAPDLLNLENELESMERVKIPL